MLVKDIKAILASNNSLDPLVTTNATPTKLNHYLLGLGDEDNRALSDAELFSLVQIILDASDRNFPEIKKLENAIGGEIVEAMSRLNNMEKSLSLRESKKIFTVEALKLIVDYTKFYKANQLLLKAQNQSTQMSDYWLEKLGLVQLVESFTLECKGNKRTIASQQFETPVAFLERVLTSSRETYIPNVRNKVVNSQQRAQFVLANPALFNYLAGDTVLHFTSWLRDVSQDQADAIWQHIFSNKPAFLHVCSSPDALSMFLYHFPAHKETFEKLFLIWVVEPLSLDLSNIAKHFPTAKSLIDAAKIYPEKMNALMMKLVAFPFILKPYIRRFEDLKLLAASFPEHKNQLAERALQWLSTAGFSSNSSEFLSFAELFPEYASDIMLLVLSNATKFLKILPLDFLVTEQEFSARLQAAHPLYAAIFEKLRELEQAAVYQAEEQVQVDIKGKIERLLTGAEDEQHEAYKWVLIVRNFCLSHPGYRPTDDGSPVRQNRDLFLQYLGRAQCRSSLNATVFLKKYNAVQFSHGTATQPVQLQPSIQAHVAEIHRMSKYLKV